MRHAPCTVDRPPALAGAAGPVLRLALRFALVGAAAVAAYLSLILMDGPARAGDDRPDGGRPGRLGVVTDTAGQLTRTLTDPALAERTEALDPSGDVDPGRAGQAEPTRPAPAARESGVRDQRESEARDRSPRAVSVPPVVVPAVSVPPVVVPVLAALPAVLPVVPDVRDVRDALPDAVDLLPALLPDLLLGAPPGAPTTPGDGDDPIHPAPVPPIVAETPLSPPSAAPTAVEQVDSAETGPTSTTGGRAARFSRSGPAATIRTDRSPEPGGQPGPAGPGLTGQQAGSGCGGADPHPALAAISSGSVETELRSSVMAAELVLVNGSPGVPTSPG